MDSRALQAGERLDRYLILREAGHGGMGTIYQARDTVLGRLVALKVLPTEYDTHREYRERFVREAQSAAKIHHRNVVAVHDVSVREPLYIVMEYLHGETFDAFLKREAPVSFERALECLLPVMSAVAAAHDSKVIHRDLKPANIMLAQERDGVITPKVLDFGISKLSKFTDEYSESASTDLDLTGHDQQIGTPSYMAPEQDGNNRSVGPWSDVYSLALMLYLAVTGKRAFVGRSVVEVLVVKRVGVFTAPSEYPFGLAPALDAWMRRALAPDPARRFATVHEMATALLALASDAQRARWEPVFSPEPSSVDLSLRDVVVMRDVTLSEVVPASDERASVEVPADVAPHPNVVEPSKARRSAAPPSLASRRERALAGALALMAIVVGVLLVRDHARSDASPVVRVVEAPAHRATRAPPDVVPLASPIASDPVSMAPPATKTVVTAPRRPVVRGTRCGPDAMLVGDVCVPVPHIPTATETP